MKLEGVVVLGLVLRGGFRMSLMSELIDEFLLGQEHNAYKNHCNKFLEYLKVYKKEDSPVTITKEDLVNCMGYYSQRKKINTVGSMSSHLESIKAFYDQMHQKGKLQNIFNTIPNYEQFKNDISKTYGLAEIQERDILPIETILEMLEYLEDNKKSLDNDLKLIKIFIKINLLAPAKRKVIADIKFKDFKDNFRVLNINNVDIDITNSLRRDILEAIDDIDASYEEEDRLFEYICTFKKYSHGVFNYPLYKLLKIIGYDVPDEKDSFPVESIMNTAIIEMIKNNTNPLLICKINGVSLSRIGDKIEKYGAEIKDYSILINREIMQAEYYKYL